MISLNRSLEGYNLLHKGAKCFSELERNGIRIDVPYCEKAAKKLSCMQRRKQLEIESSKVGKAWKKAFGSKTNWGSNAQLSHVLFNILGHTPTVLTAKGAYSTAEDSLDSIEDPAVQAFAAMKRYEKAGSTYIKNFLKMQVDGIIHPFYNLHTVQTYRSSSDSPNFQNIPVRDPEIGVMIRRAIIARPGRRLVEPDWSGNEVRAAACFHQDPVMIEYIKDPTKDMHRDMAAQIFCLGSGQVTKRLRFFAKGSFVFPQFYGSWYLPCTKNLWGAVEEKLESGVSVKEHLTRFGIRKLGRCIEGERPLPGTFEKHIQDVENDFWNVRFQVYNKWKKEWYARYLKTGYIELPTGFKCTAHMEKNQAINYAVQGTAFHWLLWTIIRLSQELRRNKMETLLVGQVHDSIEADVPEKELNSFLQLCYNLAVNEIRDYWKWIVVPLDIEVKASEVDGNWFDSKTIPIPS